MTVTFRSYFLRQLKKIKGKDVLHLIHESILDIENAENIQQIKGLKKLTGYTSAYRIKVGDYRLGITIENDTVDFCAVAHRKDIYRIFP
jgi:mRNA interferase RelE/StbE